MDPVSVKEVAYWDSSGAGATLFVKASWPNDGEKTVQIVRLVGGDLQIWMGTGA